MSEPTILITPPARIVWGHPLKSKAKTNQKTKQKILTDAGAEIPVWAFGMAFEKAIFEQQVRPYLQQEAAKMFPGGSVPADFSWKFKDGDTAVDNKGKPYRDRDGYAGHYVLAASTELKAPEAYRQDQNGTFRQISDTEIKTGYYIIAELTIKGNASPGIYVNPNMVCLVGQGDAIVGHESDPTTAFGNVNYQLPQGAQPLSAAPTVGQPAPLQQTAPVQAAVQPQPNVVPSATGTVPGATMYPINPGPAPMPGQTQPQPGQPQPAYDFIKNAGNNS